MTGETPEVCSDKRKKEKKREGLALLAVCDNTKNLNETKSKTFSDTKYFRYRIPIAKKAK